MEEGIPAAAPIVTERWLDRHMGNKLEVDEQEEPDDGPFMYEFDDWLIEEMFDYFFDE
jgi:hypothetical protein